MVYLRYLIMANKPRIRFRGFTEDWEQRKLGDIATFSKGNGYSKSDLAPSGDPIILYGRLYTNYETTIRNVDTFVELKDKSVISQGDEVIVPASGETVEDISRASVVKDQGVIIGGDLNVIKVNHLLDPTFLALTISNGEQQKELSKRAQGKSVVHLHNSDLQEVNLTFPLLNEQKEISTLFEKMDSIITLHQRKLEKLKLNKSALLQKLFPQKGCTIPDVRFKGFTDAWEQRKLNDFGIATGGTSIESEFVDGGTYKVINIGSYSEESVYNDQGLRVNKTDKTKSRILNKYDLTMILNDKTASGNIIGRVLLIDQDNTYVYNQRTERIEVDTKNFLPMFLYHMLNAPEQRKYIVKASQGNTQIYVNWSTISNIDYMIPQLLLEQEKIANLFSLINKDITLHQRKLDCLISIKKGLLQQLFV